MGRSLAWCGPWSWVYIPYGALGGSRSEALIDGASSPLGLCALELPSPPVPKKLLMLLDELTLTLRLQWKAEVNLSSAHTILKMLFYAINFLESRALALRFCNVLKELRLCDI